MIPVPSDSQKCEQSKRRMMRRTGLPASAFGPFPAIPSEPIEVDAISLQREPVPVSVEFPDAAPNRSQVVAEPEGFRIEVMRKDGTWQPVSRCLPHAKDHKTQAETMARLQPDKRPVRVCKPGATRAVYRFN